MTHYLSQSRRHTKICLSAYYTPFPKTSTKKSNCTNLFPQQLGGLIHPEDQAAVFTLFGASAQDKTGRTKFIIDYRLLTKSGNYKWYHAAGDCIRYENGIPLMAAGTILDISKQKKNQVQFEEEMEPNIAALRTGIADIASNVNKATNQMEDMSHKQKEMSDAANEIENSVDVAMGIKSSRRGNFPPARRAGRIRQSRKTSICAPAHSCSILCRLTKKIS